MVSICDVVPFAFRIIVAWFSGENSTKSDVANVVFCTCRESRTWCWILFLGFLKEVKGNCLFLFAHK